MDKKRIHEMLECMTEGVLTEMKGKGISGIETKEFGEAIDMVKDLAEAEKAVWEKCYYEKIVEAMKEEKEFEEERLKMMLMEHGDEGRMGYDRWRTSSGRFAPKGMGHETSMAMATGRAGFGGPVLSPYIPDVYMPPYMDGPMGYDGGGGNGQGRGSNGSGMGSGNQSGSGSRMGYSGGDGRDGSARDGRQSYDTARRYFHESGSQESKQMMSEKGREYVDEAIMTMKDIFSEAEPQMQEKMKQDLFRLYREFGGK